MVEMNEMRDFMGNDVTSDLGWGEDQTPAEPDLPL
jgi:hypothetical protein